MIAVNGYDCLRLGLRIFATILSRAYYDGEPFWVYVEGDALVLFVVNLDAIFDRTPAHDAIARGLQVEF